MKRKRNHKYSILTVVFTIIFLISSKTYNVNEFLDKPIQQRNINQSTNSSIDEQKSEVLDSELFKSKNKTIHSDTKINVSEKNQSNDYNADIIKPSEDSSVLDGKNANEVDLEYKGKPSVVVNNNKARFAPIKTVKVYKKYADLDRLNRVGPCEVITGPEYTPKGARKSIAEVKPTGWKQKRYNFIDGGVLYNRCHLIGFKIAGDNANWRNLMTGTRYMNCAGMLPYEEIIINYIKNTKNHVQYRVTPHFINDEKVARGVFMEAKSIENNDIEFNVYCFNVQPGVEINYNDGSSRLKKN